MDFITFSARCQYFISVAFSCKRENRDCTELNCNLYKVALVPDKKKRKSKMTDIEKKIIEILERHSKSIDMSSSSATHTWTVIHVHDYTTVAREIAALFKKRRQA